MKPFVSCLFALPFALLTSTSQAQRFWLVPPPSPGGVSALHLQDDVQIKFGNTSAAPDFWLEWDTAGTDHVALWSTDCGGGLDCEVMTINTGTDDVVWSGNISTTAGTCSCEQVTSTDDFDVTDQANVGGNVSLTAGGSVTTTSNGALTLTADGTGDIVFGAAPVVYTIPATNTVAANASTVDWDSGSMQVLDLQGASAAVVVTLSNPATGGAYLIKVIQGDFVGTITWPATVKWPGGTAPTITATNDAIDYVTLIYDGTIYLGSYVQDVK